MGSVCPLRCARLTVAYQRLDVRLEKVSIAVISWTEGRRPTDNTFYVYLLKERDENRKYWEVKLKAILCVSGI